MLIDGECTYVLARHRVDGYWMRRVCSMVRGVRRGNESSVGCQPSCRVARMVVVMELRVVEGRHAVNARAAAIHSCTLSAGARTAADAGVHAGYTHGLLSTTQYCVTEYTVKELESIK